MRTCILCFNEQFATIGEVQRYLDEVAEVGFWYRCLPNSILLTSSVEPSVLARGLQQRFVPDRLAVTKMFLIAEIQHKFTAGLLPYQAWELIEKPESPKVSKEELVTANYFVSVSHGREGSVEFQKDDKGIDVAE